ncbi:MAG: SRPBCC family protein [Planctomycetes bacterium]|nr:SRPBCC family protein [Planctomycetota bacterium]
MFRFLFGLREDVTRRAYVRWGFGLMAFKYAVEFGVFTSLHGGLYTPLDFANPVLSDRLDLASAGPEWLPAAWAAWTLPFAWVAVTMTVRRAYAAALPSALGLLIFVPYLNLFVMLAVALAPDVRWSWERRLARNLARLQQGRPQKQQPPLPAAPTAKQRQARMHRDVVTTATFAILGGAVALIAGVYGAKFYGAALFIGAPLLMGMTVGMATMGPRTGGGDSLSALLILGLLFTIFWLVGAEGLVCLAMAFPITIPFVILGVIIGRSLSLTAVRRATYARSRIALSAWSALLLLVPLESALVAPTERVVMTAVEIDAPPEVVWRHVISFPDIEEPMTWVFDLGIATPIGAHIEGEGEGAVRHCRFTTGDFVEPITAWDPPHRLAFDVTDQPPPMKELSPWEGVSPPHLDDFMRSRRGEFRLVRLPNGGTRLEGRTWYALDIHPGTMWTPWSDALVHAIHRRVLRHIRRLSERGQ